MTHVSITNAKPLTQARLRELFDYNPSDGLFRRRISVSNRKAGEIAGTLHVRMMITLPWPPSSLSPNARQHYMALARAKKAYRSACWYTEHAQGLRKMDAEKLHLSIEFVPPSRRAFDLDNCLARLKSGLDALADITGVDDKHWSLSIRRADEIGGMVRIKLEAQ